MKRCKPLQKEWNNASLSAYLTYEDKIEPIRNLHRTLGLSLREYFNYIEDRYQDFEKSDQKDFAKFLFGK